MATLGKRGKVAAAEAVDLLLLLVAWFPVVLFVVGEVFGGTGVGVLLGIWLVSGIIVVPLVYVAKTMGWLPHQLLARRFRAVRSLTRPQRVAIWTLCASILSGVAGFRAFILYKRDPAAWSSVHSMIYHRYCGQTHGSFAGLIEIHCNSTGSSKCPSFEQLCALRTTYGGIAPSHLYCPLARKHGKVGRFVYVGAGRTWDVESRTPEPIVFDYPDNHPDGGGYVLWSNRQTTHLDSAQWRQFLAEHLPKGWEPENNDLSWWQWAP